MYKVCMFHAFSIICYQYLFTKGADNKKLTQLKGVIISLLAPVDQSITSTLVNKINQRQTSTILNF